MRKIEEIKKERKHKTDGTPCWCNPKIIKVKAKETVENQTKNIQDWLNYLVEMGYINAKINVDEFVSQIRKETEVQIPIIGTIVKDPKLGNRVVYKENGNPNPDAVKGDNSRQGRGGIDKKGNL